MRNLRRSRTALLAVQREVAHRVQHLRRCEDLLRSAAVKSQFLLPRLAALLGSCLPVVSDWDSRFCLPAWRAAHCTTTPPLASFDLRK